MIIPQELYELNKRDNFWLKKSLMKEEYVKPKYKLTIKNSINKISNHLKESFPKLTQRIFTAKTTNFSIGQIEYSLFTWDSCQKGILIEKIIETKTNSISDDLLKCFLKEIGEVKFYWNDNGHNVFYDYFTGISLYSTSNFEKHFEFDEDLKIDINYRALLNSLRIISDDGGDTKLTYSSHDNHLYAININIEDNNYFDFITGIYFEKDIIFSISKCNQYNNIKELINNIFD